MTTVRILDHHPTGHINLEAEVNYPEDDGIIQVEHFCIHFSKEGTVRLCWAHHSPALFLGRKEGMLAIMIEMQQHLLVYLESSRMCR